MYSSLNVFNHEEGCSAVNLDVACQCSGMRTFCTEFGSSELTLHATNIRLIPDTITKLIANFSFSIYGFLWSKDATLVRSDDDKRCRRSTHMSIPVQVNVVAEMPNRK